ncbi:imidazole glycerol phosphate synthase subunit HisH [Prosthecobacter sp.]|uniref:imidazole glycerol phosphate synthase subunit HisH n=1 Tax=Prosthecobacter sp. TaxID=1965333 RepID=UPI001DE66014|nr:imidazole glycerol phosphate synthase subunit HisH [Prosthecobacter sp.]MCB1275639.1 imidazole glycerol phosphate synthase subunit HisH [Prosthecobacter sp.]
MKLGVLDYGAGNLRSVLNAFEAIGAHANLVTKPEDFEGIDVLVFPGQGAFGDSVRILKDTHLWEPLRAWLKAEKPYLGICLGYQLLFESSEECPGVEGLAAVAGKVRKFDATSGLKIPHMGWNVAQWETSQSAVWDSLPNPTHVYFVHSYYPEVADESLALCRTDYGVSFISGIAKKNLVAVQFHPEKSQEAGLTLLRNSLKVLEQ